MKAFGLALGGVVLALGLVTTAGCGGRSGADATPTEGPGVDIGVPADSGPEDALRQYSENTLSRLFAGSCDSAQRSEDVGKICYTLRGERIDMKAYWLGPTFSEANMTVIVKKDPVGGWQVIKTENRDPSKPPSPGIPWPIEAGAYLRVVGTGDCLRMRETPSVQGAVITCLPDDMEVRVQEGPAEADGYTWWKIVSLGGSGWVAQDWLRYPEEAPAATTPTPAITPQG